MERVFFHGIGLIAFIASALPGGALASECSGWLPDLDRDCERPGRPAWFAAPIVSPFLFEDAFIATGVQVLHMSQKIPDESALGGGEAEVVAGQLHLSITDRLGFVCAKAGAIWTRPESPYIPNRQTPLPMTLGLEYGFHQDADSGRFAAFALRYGDAFQGGDGSLIPSLAVAARFGDMALQADVGGSWALDSSFSSSVFWHAHAAWAGLPVITPFAQLSGIHWVDGGDGSATLPLTPLGQRIFHASSVSMRTIERRSGSFEGADLVNLGARGAQGLELVTGAAGVRLRVGRVSVSAAYERPLTKHKGVFADRITSSVSIEL